MLSGKTFMVTGSTGRIGCDIVFRLETLGAKVVPLVLSGYPVKPVRIKWQAKTAPILIQASRDLASLPTPDYVINLHWRVQRDLSFTKQLLYDIDHNLHRLSFLWEWIKGKKVKRFVNISSIKVFSRLNAKPVTSKMEPRPISPYGITKLAAESFFNAYFAQSDLPITHLYLGPVAAYGGHPSQLLCQLNASAFEHKQIRIVKGHISYILYVDEAVDFIINAALKAKGPRYILAAAKGMENSQIAQKFEQITGRELNAEYVNPSPDSADPAFISDLPELKADWIRYTSFEKMVEKISALFAANAVKKQDDGTVPKSNLF
jgi:nucleoside-diphosphate-sugar epimerase